MHVAIGIAQNPDPCLPPAGRSDRLFTPGRILAAEAVWAAAQDLFAVAERKELAVKGRAQTVIAYECRPA